MRAQRVGIIGGNGWIGGAVARAAVGRGLLPPEDLTLSCRSTPPGWLPEAHWTDDNPALLAVALIRDAVAHGLPPEVARRSVTALLVGTGRLLEKKGENPGDTVAAFIDYRGVTAAGISAMRAAGFDAAVSAGLAAALEKSLALRA